MRLSRVFPAHGLLFGARASQLDSRVPHALDARDDLDVCVSLNTELQLTDRRRGDRCVDLRLKVHACGVLIPDSSTDACLCLSGISSFLETDVVGVLAVTIDGEQAVSDILTQLVRGYWCFAGVLSDFYTHTHTHPIRSTMPPHQETASTRSTARPPASTETHADSCARTDSRLSLRTNRKSANARGSTWKSATTNAFPRVRVPRIGCITATTTDDDGSAAALARRRDTAGWRAVSTTVVHARGSASTRSAISKAVSHCLFLNFSFRLSCLGRYRPGSGHRTRTQKRDREQV